MIAQSLHFRLPRVVVLYLNVIPISITTTKQEQEEQPINKCYPTLDDTPLPCSARTDIVSQVCYTFKEKKQN